MTQPLQSSLARKWVLEVNTAVAGGGAVGTAPLNATVPVWTTVKGINQFTPTPFDPNIEDDNVYEDGGYGGRTKTMLKWSLAADIMRRTVAGDITTYDPGQEALRALAGVLGPNGVAQVRWYDRNGGPEAYSGFCEVQWVNSGGAVNNLEKCTITLLGKGSPTTIVNPNAVAIPLPVVLAVTPATGLAANAVMVKITGTGFMSSGTVLVTGAGGVKLSGVNAVSYFVDDQNTIYASLPITTAGTKNVTVTNATGTSAATGNYVAT